MSNTDTLTGIANRRLLNQVFIKEITRSQRYGSRFSVIMLDVDHFKTINDEFGHQIGDQILTGIAGLMAETIRISDLAGRWGGEHFAIALPNTTGAQAHRVAERIQQAMNELVLNYPGRGNVPAPTVSQGLALFPHQASETIN